jgi:hypothetical protein
MLLLLLLLLLCVLMMVHLQATSPALYFGSEFAYRIVSIPEVMPVAAAVAAAFGAVQASCRCCTWAASPLSSQSHLQSPSSWTMQQWKRSVKHCWPKSKQQVAQAGTQQQHHHQQPAKEQQLWQQRILCCGRKYQAGLILQTGLCGKMEWERLALMVQMVRQGLVRLGLQQQLLLGA